MLTITPFSPSAIVQVGTNPLQLSSEVNAEVEYLWRAEKKRRGKELFNGEILSAITTTSEGIIGQIVEYRHLIAQRTNPEFFEILQVRPVAVSGLLECSEGIVFGQRANSLTQSRGLWELVPSGGLDTKKAKKGNTIDYLAQILIELEEETGISSDFISKIKPFCLVEDLDSHVIDIGIILSSPLSAKAVKTMHQNAATNEYQELTIVPKAKIAKFIANNHQHIVNISIALINNFQQQAHRN